MVKERQTRLKEYLANEAGKDPGLDREMVGMIKAYQTLLDIDYEEGD